MTTATESLSTAAKASKWITENVNEEGRLTDEDNQFLIDQVALHELPLVIFKSLENQWVIALEEPLTALDDCYWFISVGIKSADEAKRCLLRKFQDNTNFRVIRT